MRGTRLMGAALAGALLMVGLFVGLAMGRDRPGPLGVSGEVRFELLLALSGGLVVGAILLAAEVGVGRRLERADRDRASAELARTRNAAEVALLDAAWADVEEALLAVLDPEGPLFGDVRAGLLARPGTRFSPDVVVGWARAAAFASVDDDGRPAAVRVAAKASHLDRTAGAVLGPLVAAGDVDVVRRVALARAALRHTAVVLPRQLVSHAPVDPFADTLATAFEHLRATWPMFVSEPVPEAGELEVLGSNTVSYSATSLWGEQIPFVDDDPDWWLLPAVGGLPEWRRLPTVQALRVLLPWPATVTSGRDAELAIASLLRWPPSLLTAIFGENVEEPMEPTDVPGDLRSLGDQHLWPSDSALLTWARRRVHRTATLLWPAFERLDTGPDSVFDGAFEDCAVRLARLQAWRLASYVASEGRVDRRPHDVVDAEHQAPSDPWPVAAELRAANAGTP